MVLLTKPSISIKFQMDKMLITAIRATKPISAQAVNFFKLFRFIILSLRYKANIKFL